MIDQQQNCFMGTYYLGMPTARPARYIQWTTIAQPLAIMIAMHRLATYNFMHHNKKILASAIGCLRIPAAALAHIITELPINTYVYIFWWAVWLQLSIDHAVRCQKCDWSREVLILLVAISDLQISPIFPRIIFKWDINVRVSESSSPRALSNGAYNVSVRKTVT